MSQPLSIGRIVHFVLPSGKVRPAIVVETFSPGTANLSVFLDGTNDAGEKFEGTCVVCPDLPTAWATSVTEDPEGKRACSWHWPPRS